MRNNGKIIFRIFGALGTKKTGWFLILATTEIHTHNLFLGTCLIQGILASRWGISKSDRGAGKVTRLLKVVTLPESEYRKQSPTYIFCKVSSQSILLKVNLLTLKLSELLATYNDFNPRHLSLFKVMTLLEV